MQSREALFLSTLVFLFLGMGHANIMGSYVLIEQGNQGLYYQVRLKWLVSQDFMVKEPEIPKDHPLFGSILVQSSNWQEGQEMIQVFDFHKEGKPTLSQIPGLKIPYIDGNEVRFVHLEPMHIKIEDSTQKKTILASLLSAFILALFGSLFYRKRKLTRQSTGHVGGRCRVRDEVCRTFYQKQWQSFFCLCLDPGFDGFENISREELQKASNEFNFAGRQPSRRLIEKLSREFKKRNENQDHSESDEEILKSLVED